MSRELTVFILPGLGYSIILKTVKMLAGAKLKLIVQASLPKVISG